MALLVVVILVVPTFAAAGQPSVQAPTGPQSGGVFTGTYTFATYISCTSGLNFNSSYSNNLEGTHTFTFYGAADGSLLVSIDGGGMMLITSCGDPFTSPDTNVATYTVTKYAAGPPPTPTPPPAPTPTPTPTPTSGGTSGGGGGSGGNHATPAKSTAPTASPAITPGASSSPLSSAQPTPSSSVTPSPTPTNSISPAVASSSNKPSPPRRLSLAWTVSGLASLALLLLLLWLWRSPDSRERLRSSFTPLRLRLEPYWFRLRHRLWHPLPVRGRDLPKRRGFSEHHHSGKLLAHHHTSYPALAFLILVAGVLTAGISLSSQAASSLLTFTVQGPPPTIAATIDQPTDGQHFTTPTQTVRGTCPSGLGLEIYRNGAFAGSTMCDVNGLYAVLITLVPDQNDLVARDVDALSQYGPDSTTVSVFYDAPPPPTPTPTPSPTATPSPAATPQGAPRSTPRPTATPKIAILPAPTLDSAEHFYQGVEVNTPVTWEVVLSGGRAPYRVTWEWGDGTSDTLSVASAGTIKHDHTYDKPGTYQVTVRVKDALGRETVLQVVVIVNGQITAASLGQSGGQATSQAGNLVVVWPLLAIAGLVVLSFWLGEHHKLSILRPQPPEIQAT
jgi:hypothetical protein